MNEIDDAIGRVEILYRTLTGRDAPAPDVPYAPIPAEHDPAQHVQEQMDRLLRLMGGAPDAPGGPAMTSTWTPPMGVWEGPQDILFAIDVPGVPRDQVEVSIQGSMVVVSGRRGAPDGADTQRLRPRGAEQPIGMFRRVITLPPTVQRDQVTAWLKDGVLWLRLPNEAATTVRNVAVS